MYSFDTSTCYTYYESIQQHPPNLYHLVHCMRSIDRIIQYSVAYLCGHLLVLLWFPFPPILLTELQTMLSTIHSCTPCYNFPCNSWNLTDLTDLTIPSRQEALPDSCLGHILDIRHTHDTC
ncbi:hypothetical protein L208DRAFT_1559724 [Tricholoma matsutake]|nr:hypothetical protein L208DRAFT_1559724 [Tricholoma matsutake 945]